LTPRHTDVRDGQRTYLPLCVFVLRPSFRLKKRGGQRTAANGCCTFFYQQEGLWRDAAMGGESGHRLCGARRSVTRSAALDARPFWAQGEQGPSANAFRRTRAPVRNPGRNRFGDTSAQGRCFGRRGVWTNLAGDLVGRVVSDGTWFHGGATISRQGNAIGAGREGGPCAWLGGRFVRAGLGPPNHHIGANGPGAGASGTRGQLHPQRDVGGGRKTPVPPSDGWRLGRELHACWETHVKRPARPRGKTHPDPAAGRADPSAAAS